MYRMSWSVDRPPCLLLRVEKIRAIFYVKLLLLSSFESCERRRRRSRFSKCFYEYFVHLTQRWVYQDHTAFYAGSIYVQQQDVRTYERHLCVQVPYVFTTKYRLCVCVQQVKCRQKRAQIADDKDFEYQGMRKSKSHNTQAVWYGTREWLYEYDVIGTPGWVRIISK